MQGALVKIYDFGCFALQVQWGKNDDPFRSDLDSVGVPARSATASPHSQCDVMASQLRLDRRVLLDTQPKSPQPCAAPH